MASKMDNKDLFTGKSEDYSGFRPSYPAAAVDWLRKKNSGEQVLDVGAGTGIFTKLLLRCFRSVTALEPNGDMRREFMRLLPEIPCLESSGEATTLPAHSVDLVTVAQAFHWLDEEKFKKEMMRILRPEGKTAIIWNTSLKTPFSTDRDRVSQKYCPRFRSGHAGKRSAAEGDIFLREIYFRQVEVVSFSNPFPMDRCTFLGNIRSRSYAPAPGDEAYENFMAEQNTVFERYAKDGIVTEEQETQIYLGSF